jgi:hypothetical protein
MYGGQPLLLNHFLKENILFPDITYILGPSVGNLFKVTHDSALFFKELH